MTWCVGFDLDMTLVDSRPGIVAALDALAEETGVAIDSASVAANLGPPITEVLGPIFGARADEALIIFRRLMAEIGVFGATPLPGAAEALGLVHRLGGQSVVVTAKHKPLAEATLDACALEADLVEGDLWAEEKAVALLRHHAVGYFGDHVGDVRAARKASVWCAAIATGGTSREELLEAGATVVFASLLEALPWLEDTISG